MNVGSAIDTGNANDVPPSTARRYKACRICRRQKTRCDGRDPCHRCRVAGYSCIYDRAAGRRRTIEQQHGVKASARGGHAIPSGRNASGQLRIPSVTATAPCVLSGSNEHAPTTTDTCSVLSPADLAAPGTAVHVMIHPSAINGPQRNAAGWSPENQSKWHREEYSRQSIIDKTGIDETLARRLFGSFMQHCNIATPISDPVLDTFESVSELSPMTLTAMLYVAARQELPDDQVLALEKEGREIAADTLFQNPCSVDAVNAMLLLAIHAEKTWFALGHVHQLAWDLALPRSMVRVLSKPESFTRYDSQCARIWLFVVYFERAVALLTAREPRCEKIERKWLMQFAERRSGHPSDIFFCACTELFDMSADLREAKDIPTLEELDEKLEEWCARWSAVYESQSVHASSLQRVHLRVQMLLAKVWQLAIILGQTLQTDNHSVQNESIPDEIIQTTRDLFAFITSSSTYQTYFPWSPTYEALLLTFAVIVSVKALSLYPDSNRQSGFKTVLSPIVGLLSKHPCQQFGRIVGSLHQNLGTVSDPDAGSRADAADVDIGWLGEEWDVELDGLFGDFLRNYS